MQAYYPLSIPLQCYGLNITVVTYMNTLNFGYIGCRDTLPHLQRLTVYSREALEETGVAGAERTRTISLISLSEAGNGPPGSPAEARLPPT